MKFIKSKLGKAILGFLVALGALAGVLLQNAEAITLPWQYPPESTSTSMYSLNNIKMQG